MRRSIAVYAARTVDIVDGEERPGGPGFYARQALRLTGLTDYMSIEEPLSGCVAHFLHSHDGRVRRSTLLEPPRCSVEPRGFHDAAIVSPVACEIGYEDAATIARHAGVTLVDLQGFTRTCSRGPVGTIRHRITETPATVVKASLEDLGMDLEAAYALLEVDGPAASIVTMGDAGLVAHGAWGCVSCAPPARRDVDTVGAGDIFAALLAAALLLGSEPLGALCRAAYATGCVLEARRRGAEPGGCSEAFWMEDWPRYAAYLPRGSSCLCTGLARRGW